MSSAGHETAQENLLGGNEHVQLSLQQPVFTVNDSDDDEFGCSEVSSPVRSIRFTRTILLLFGTAMFESDSVEDWLDVPC